VASLALLAIASFISMRDALADVRSPPRGGAEDL
jgi:hypothetical protein